MVLLTTREELCHDASALSLISDERWDTHLRGFRGKLNPYKFTYFTASNAVRSHATRR
jgi:hypothetical protein